MAAASSLLPVTELANELTDEIDAQGAEGFARTLRATDGQIFAGWRGRECMFDARILREAAKAARAMALLLRWHLSGAKVAATGAPAKVAIVFTGCGTSGRVGFLVARRFNAMLRARGHEGTAFRYLISGGDSALLLSDELPEDDPVTGAAELQAVVDAHHATLLVGITCGLSAPYVAGQLDLALRLSSKSGGGGSSGNAFSLSGPGGALAACVMGFNSVEQSRDRPIELWEDGRSFRDVLFAMRQRCNNSGSGGSDGSGRLFSIVNPILGPARAN